jgi:hypothetical protein
MHNLAVLNNNEAFCKEGSGRVGVGGEKVNFQRL